MIRYLVILGAIVQLYGKYFYIKKTLKGQTKPNRMTWLMWSIAPLIASAAAFSAGSTWAALPVFMSGFAPLLVFLASFADKNAYWKLKYYDYICGTFSLLAIIFWIVTKDPLTAIILAIASDLVAAIPTLAKCWVSPETESGIAYAAGLFSATTSLLAVNNWRFTEYAFPLYLIIINYLLIFAIYRKRPKKESLLE